MGCPAVRVLLLLPCWAWRPDGKCVHLRRLLAQHCVLLSSDLTSPPTFSFLATPCSGVHRAGCQGGAPHAPGAGEEGSGGAGRAAGCRAHPGWVLVVVQSRSTVLWALPQKCAGQQQMPCRAVPKKPEPKAAAVLRRRSCHWRFTTRSGLPERFQSLTIELTIRSFGLRRWRRRRGHQLAAGRGQRGC